MGADRSDAGGVVIAAGCSCMLLLPVSDVADGMLVLKGMELDFTPKGVLPEILEGLSCPKPKRGFGNSFQPAIDAPRLEPH
ncbi:hypothetical protein MTR_5g023160 [Medicago truncatula]|uniref:Uncharacterized protein n=1 Tax=Medicago truncatula TaxID=3880 RepID=G7JYT0_MEDTR|nr:hypothetical protein MTR_5g023160 [Medicago truncatula]